jgi:hypothetical protein
MLLSLMIDPFDLVTRWCMRRKLLPHEPLPFQAMFMLQVADVRSARVRLVAPDQERVS